MSEGFKVNRFGDEEESVPSNSEKGGNSELSRWVTRRQKELDALKGKIEELSTQETRTEEENIELESLKHREDVMSQEISELQRAVDAGK